MVFKLVTAAAKTWRRLKGENQLPKLVQGVTFTNRVEVIKMPDQNAARPQRDPNSTIARMETDIPPLPMKADA
jgi:hypothetical protein